MKHKFGLLFLLVLGACASRPLAPPYPSYIDVNELPDAFIAGLPGVRAKQLSVDPRTQRASYRVQLPADWSFTTGASPGQSVEIFVLAGEVSLGEFALKSGGYAYLPPGHTGSQMESSNGALMLYFLDDSDDAAMIQTPLITSSELIDWQAEDIGVSVKELRRDPGSGARSWLRRIESQAILPLQKSNQNVEGYLVSGSIMYSECSEGMSGTDQYLPGGYFHRPPGATHAGPETTTESNAVWYLRVLGEEQVETVASCPQPE
ncbi:MAG: DUF4437 domain-containing protein [Woeseiaceae bacterium]